MKLFLNKKKISFCFSLATLTPLTPLEAVAHGTMETPISRVYNCYKENPENPKSEACKAVVRTAGPQTLYDWNGVRNTGGVSPANGTLCSGGDRNRGLDLAGQNWIATDISPNKDGKLDFVYLATANHPTETVEYYITKNGYDPKNPLNWFDLENEPFCVEDLRGSLLSSSHHKHSCPFPTGKSGKHIIYSVWKIYQNNGEAFYSCIDVNIKGTVNPPDQEQPQVNPPDQEKPPVTPPPTQETGDVGINFWISPNFNLDLNTFSLDLIVNDQIKIPLKYGVIENSRKLPVGIYNNVKVSTLTKDGYVYFGALTNGKKEINSFTVSKKEPLKLTVSVDRKPVSQNPGTGAEQGNGKIIIDVPKYPAIEVPSGLDLFLLGSNDLKIPIVNGITQVEMKNGTYNNLRVTSGKLSDGYIYSGMPTINNTVINSITVKNNIVNLSISITKNASGNNNTPEQNQEKGKFKVTVQNTAQASFSHENPIKVKFIKDDAIITKKINKSGQSLKIKEGNYTINVVSPLKINGKKYIVTSNTQNINISSDKVANLKLTITEK